MATEVTATSTADMEEGTEQITQVATETSLKDAVLNVFLIEAPRTSGTL